MAVVLLKNLTDRINILEQQNVILSYARKNRISIETTEIETSDSKKSLEERNELKGFLRSLNQDSDVLIYDFWVLSSDVSDLIKILECMLRRNITLHACNQKEAIGINSNLLDVLELLAKQRVVQAIQKESIKQGRPKGRMSQSKFDKYRSQIINLLEQKYSVSKIAQELGVSRTSLKDYINSRNLKNLATTKQDLLGAKPAKIMKRTRRAKKCDLIAQKDEG